jgi:acylphosphatase
MVGPAGMGDDKGLAGFQAVVRGRVQGVGFRYFTKREAELLGLSGHVRNCIDGSVEVVAEGRRPSLDLFLARLREGSRGGFVSHVEVEWQAATGEYERFDLHF